ncbi:Aca2/YdiL-like domain-containing protein [Phocoenobacter skyensis]|uniref:Uncharacterized protein n=1 Tax=Phocoenobacter skyensis TaxID=97481 RepID=A0A1H7XJQ8_9PAST|nr:DUF1870 family protein [Pasteurella skyensis]MDP8184389.1 DUF1870 family protein [Pasteurella skyensis]QLB22608.1 hypothetical protein A6B44_05065 [Pasteurella skyensis]SEM33895.1 protein of unknown function [Pasteurella skyensis]
MSLNNLELRSTRVGLGLTVAEASDLAKVKKRSFQYWEQGRYDVPDEVSSDYALFSRLYDDLLTNMLKDIGSHKISLPYFKEFDYFVEKTGCELVIKWRLYQSVLNHLMLTTELIALDDKSQIPENFWAYKWLKTNTI